MMSDVEISMFRVKEKKFPGENVRDYPGIVRLSRRKKKGGKKRRQRKKDR